MIRTAIRIAAFRSLDLAERSLWVAQHLRHGLLALAVLALSNMTLAATAAAPTTGASEGSTELVGFEPVVRKTPKEKDLCHRRVPEDSHQGYLLEKVKDCVISQADSFETQRKAWLELNLNGGNIVTLPSNSKITIAELYEDKAWINVFFGKVLVTLSQRFSRAFTLCASSEGDDKESRPICRIKVKATDPACFKIEWQADSRRLIVIVYRGSLRVEAGGRERVVEAGERIRLQPDEPPPEPSSWPLSDPPSLDDSATLQQDPDRAEPEDSVLIEDAEPNIFRRF